MAYVTCLIVFYVCKCLHFINHVVKFSFRIYLYNIVKYVLKDNCLNFFSISSKPLDNASKLAQMVEKKLEEYYKMDEKGLIKVTVTSKQWLFGICCIPNQSSLCSSVF